MGAAGPMTSWTPWDEDVGLLAGLLDLSEAHSESGTNALATALGEVVGSRRAWDAVLAELGLGAAPIGIVSESPIPTAHLIEFGGPNVSVNARQNLALLCEQVEDGDPRAAAARTVTGYLNSLFPRASDSFPSSDALMASLLAMRREQRDERKAKEDPDHRPPWLQFLASSTGVAPETPVARKAMGRFADRLGLTLETAQGRERARVVCEGMNSIIGGTDTAWASLTAWLPSESPEVEFSWELKALLESPRRAEVQSVLNALGRAFPSLLFYLADVLDYSDESIYWVGQEADGCVVVAGKPWILLDKDVELRLTPSRRDYVAKFLAHIDEKQPTINPSEKKGISRFLNTVFDFRVEVQREFSGRFQILRMPEKTPLIFRREH